jgi:hypothetical protein
MGLATVAACASHRISHAAKLDGRFQRLPDVAETTEFSCLGLTLPCWHVSEPRCAAGAVLLGLRHRLTLMKQ